MSLFAYEICAGAGGQAIGLEMAGFEHAGAVEIDGHACATLRLNRPHWHVNERDVRELESRDLKDIALFAGGVPCPPFSIAGKQLGADDERDLFPEALRLIDGARPEAVMLENVPGFAGGKFSDYRKNILRRLGRMGYQVSWQVLNACNYGVPQLRPRFVLVGLKEKYADYFAWPEASRRPKTVGDALYDLMSSRNWQGAAAWRVRANAIGPTIVGGSKKHGGPDLGPTRARHAWSELGVDGLGIANEPPAEDFPRNSMPRLTVRMAARIQGFPDSWIFEGKKTAAYRQVGNAFPPPVAKAVGASIYSALQRRRVKKNADDLFHALT